MVAAALSVTVYVPALVIMAESAEPGTWFGLQFAATFQLPPFTLVHAIFAASTSSTLRRSITDVKMLRIVVFIVFFRIELSLKTLSQFTCGSHKLVTII